MVRSAVSFLVLPALLTLACSSDDAGVGARNCYKQIPAYLRAADGRSCGVKDTLDVEVCERLPVAKCTTTKPSYVCVGSPGDKGFVVVLSPCAELESLPQGWGLGEDQSTGPNAQADCQVERNFCDGGATAGGAGGAAGTGGSGTGGGGAAGMGATGGTGGGGGGAAGGGPGTGGGGGAGAGTGGKAGTGG